MKKIGIPQALLYHRYYPAWQKFFSELGLKVVKSVESNSEIMSRGVKIASDEVCIPVKLFLGHVDYLKDKVDYLFIPRLVSVKKSEYICPKFMGVPDIVEHTISGLPEVITPTINLRSSRLSLLKNIYQLGRRFDVNLIETCRAAIKAEKNFREYKKKQLKEFKEGDEQIAVLGHEYIIYDKYISMNILQRLKEMNINVVTPEMVSEAEIANGSAHKFTDMFWTFGRKMMQEADYFLNQKQIKGIIQLTAFGCGPDSLVGEMIERRSRTYKPVMTLNLDEHTGEAGLITRIEAFLDMINSLNRGD